MAGRQAPRASTSKLALWAALMFLLGLGLGYLLTTQSCHKRGRLPGEDEQAPPRPLPRHPGARPVPQPLPQPESPRGAPKEAPGEAPKDLPVPPAASPAKPPSPPKAAPGLPRLALVIDDLGYAPPELVTRLCAQSVPFSVAVLPYQEHTQVSAEIAHGQGKEVMLHLPMEPLGYPGPGKDPGPQAVLFDLPERQIRERVRKALADIPYRKGVNNHMGSRITPDRTRMVWILEEIKARHCFFVDSRTEKDSVAFAVAQELGIPSVQRKVFLDDDKSFPAITKQWDRALAMAEKDGQVLIIGHIYPETVAALERLIPAAQGRVTFVHASALAR
jgi:polysaccharide deacetylase 2 family uncharacterized protein YibQ